MYDFVKKKILLSIHKLICQKYRKGGGRGLGWYKLDIYNHFIR